MVPFFSIVTVTYKDAWAFTKTARSVFRQACRDFEYIVIDGDSQDGTRALTDFWRGAGLVNKSLHEPDGGVYEAMNKGLEHATGRYVCFLNAGDVFANDRVLEQAQNILQDQSLDGCMGWGQLNDQIWASWRASAAFKIASLGFCHQALFVRRELLTKCPFDTRRHKTDSDTLQLGRLFEAGSDIRIVPDVWAIRGGEPGISANLERTRISIVDTLVTEYPTLSEQDADRILAFRRRGEEVAFVSDLLTRANEPLGEHLACLVLDTLFQKPTRNLDAPDIRKLFERSAKALGPSAKSDISDLLAAQAKRARSMDQKAEAATALKQEISEFREQEERRLSKISIKPASSVGHQDFIVALTSFPARLSTLHFVVRSLVEQTQPPSQIFLTLGRDEVPNRNWLSRTLLDFEDRGLVVNFVDKTFHQYDKYIHLADKNADRPFVIVDDDVIYPPYSMEMLLASHHNHRHAVIGNRCHLMAVDHDGGIGAYDQWERERQLPTPSFRLMPTGAGGVLYPEGFLTDPIATNVDLILANAPYADDLWLKTCALAKGVPTFATRLSQGADWYHRYTPTMRAGTLMAENVELGLNDMQLSCCTEWLNHTAPDWRDLLELDLAEAAE